MEVHIFSILISLSIFALIADFIASILSLPVYYRSGIMLYHRSCRCTVSPDGLVNVLNNAFNKALFPPLMFRNIGRGNIGFQEKPFCLKLLYYTPLLSGLIEFKDNGTKVIVSGRIGWLNIIFISCFCLIFVTIKDPTLVPIKIIGILVVSISGIQLIRYNEVFKFIKNQYSLVN
ncbi:MAG: hypothetical protein MJE63_17285 [Proteobacteria bacterium]|nr:hypothetical protein [Pseudomonadota bacterium]